MITDINKWQTVEKVKAYEIRKQFINPHKRWLYAVFGWGTYETGVQTSIYKSLFKQEVSFWTIEECRKWANFQK